MTLKWVFLSHRLCVCVLLGEPCCPASPHKMGMFLAQAGSLHQHCMALRPDLLCAAGSIVHNLSFFFSGVVFFILKRLKENHPDATEYQFGGFIPRLARVLRSGHIPTFWS